MEVENWFSCVIYIKRYRMHEWSVWLRRCSAQVWKDRARVWWHISQSAELFGLSVSESDHDNVGRNDGTGARTGMFALLLVPDEAQVLSGWPCRGIPLPDGLPLFIQRIHCLSLKLSYQSCHCALGRFSGTALITSSRISVRELQTLEMVTEWFRYSLRSQFVSKIRRKTTPRVSKA